MAKEVTKRSENYSQWYNNLVVKADLAEQSAVRGCMVIKPYGYAIWEKMQRILDDMFKATGVQNAYFPLFIPKSFFSREAEHVAGFAKTLKTLSEAMGKEVTMSAEKKAEIDANHADSEGLAPFLAYLCTDQGKQYTAQVFSVTASGKVDVYSAPVRLREISKGESLWTVEELAACVPSQLMPDYQNPAESRHY